MFVDLDTNTLEFYTEKKFGLYVTQSSAFITECYYGIGIFTPKKQGYYL